ncbi:dimethylamine monooxygenase subunit DmmA family protein [Gordonia sp. CPCC 205515]|uniref:dimethylamine monooxygenase subunit DmmA family protein n=1 Tax=Gordonia sp. CPCC 205515 TaxID=3140791 RepID=UPI003AF390E2
MAQIDVSSIPDWARPASSTTDGLPDFGGRSYVVVSVGDEAAAMVERWTPQLPHDIEVSRVVADDSADAADELRVQLASATVGVRVVLAGPAGACLHLRGVATTAGLEDDEIHVTRCGAGPIEIFCSHCRETTVAVADVDDLVDCAGCGRSLLVYHHVSRRSGRYLGFMVDAETPTAPTSDKESVP